MKVDGSASHKVEERSESKGILHETNVNHALFYFMAKLNLILLCDLLRYRPYHRLSLEHTSRVNAI